MSANKELISFYKKLNQSSQATKAISVDMTLKMIKDHNLKNKIEIARRQGKSHPDEKYELWQYGEKVKVNYYQFIKNQAGAVSWSVNLKGKPRKKSELNDENLTGYIYYDVDDTNLPSDEIVSRLSKLLYPVAAWRSFGLKGAGLLIKVNGLTIDNYLYNWKKFKTQIENHLTKEDFNGEKVHLVFDKATKDYTRLNVISYDPNLYVADDYITMLAQEAPQKNKKKKVSSFFDISEYKVSNTVLEYVLNKWYSNSECRHGDERLTYNFYVQYFSECNFLGIDYESALDFLSEKSNEKKYNLLFHYRDLNKIDGYGTHIYNSYSNQHGNFVENALNDITDEILSINNAFKGTFRQKQLYIDFLLGSRKKITYNERLATYLAIKMKEKGIEKELLYDFFKEKNRLNKDIIKKIDSIYSNPYYIFGVVLKKPSEKKIEQLVLDYIENLKSQGYSVYKNSFYPIEELEIEFCDNENVKVIHFITKCIINNISFDTAYEFMVSKWNELSYSKDDIMYFYHLSKLENFYKIGIQKEIKIESASNEPTQILKLRDNEYLSDLKLNFKRNTILWSDTGTGKTTYICSQKEGMHIILVPVIPLLRSIENNHKVSVFYGEKKNVTKLSNIIICTYASFPTLFSKMRSGDYDMTKYILHVDEGHNFVCSTSDQFRSEEMNFILSKMSFFSKRILYTGTHIQNIIPEFQNYDLIRIKKKRDKKYKIVKYIDKALAAEKLCDKDGLNLIYLQSKKMERDLGKFKTLFLEKGWKEEEMIFLNNNNKDKPFFERIIKDEVIDPKTKLVFATSLVAEGINLKNDNIKTLHFCTNESTHIMEQVVNRFRKIVPENIFIYEKYSENKSPSYYSGLISYQKELLDSTEKILEVVKSVKNRGLVKNLCEKHHLISFNGKHEVNYLSIAYEAYLSEMHYAHNNKEYMLEVLKEYDWIYEGEIIVENQINSDLKKKLKKMRQVEKNNIFDHKVRIKGEIFKETPQEIRASIQEENVTKIGVYSSLPDFEFQLRSSIVYLMKYESIDTIVNIMEVWQNNNFTSNWYKRFISQYRIHRQKKEGFFDNRIDYNSAMSKELVKKFFKWKKDGKMPMFYQAGLIKLINDIGEEQVESFEQAKNILQKYFVLEQRLDKRKTIRYTITSINGESEEVEHYHMLKALINSAISGKILNKFTKTDILTYVKIFRKKLPACNYIDHITPLTEATAFKILQYYCDINRCSKGTYEIVPSEINKIISSKTNMVQSGVKKMKNNSSL